MSVDAFIGVIATLIGGLITFALGFQIMNTIEVNKKLYQFEEKIEKKNREHNEKIETNNQDNKRQYLKSVKIIRSKFANEIDKVTLNIDNKITAIENNVQNKIKEIDNQLSSLSHIGYTLQVESIDTRLRILIKHIEEEDSNYLDKIIFILNGILAHEKHNQLAIIISKEIRWDETYYFLNLFEEICESIINKSEELINQENAEYVKSELLRLLDMYKEYHTPYIGCINIIDYIIDNMWSDNKEAIDKVNIMMWIFRKEFNNYIIQFE